MPWHSLTGFPVKSGSPTDCSGNGFCANYQSAEKEAFSVFQSSCPLAGKFTCAYS
jgi:hypothetical protein